MKARLSLDRSPLTEITGQETPVEASSFFVSHGSFGIVDLGASQTVIGEHQVNEVIQQLPKSTPVREVSCSTVFRFGNSSTDSTRTLLCQDLHRAFENAVLVIK